MRPVSPIAYGSGSGCSGRSRPLASRIDRVDRMFYVFIPRLGHLLVVGSAVTLFAQRSLSAELMAAALITLLLAAIKSA